MSVLWTDHTPKAGILDVEIYCSLGVTEPADVILLFLLLLDCLSKSRFVCLPVLVPNETSGNSISSTFWYLDFTGGFSPLFLTCIAVAGRLVELVLALDWSMLTMSTTSVGWTGGDRDWVFEQNLFRSTVSTATCGRRKRIQQVMMIIYKHADSHWFLTCGNISVLEGIGNSL